MTLSEAAERWGVSTTVVRKWVHQGRLVARRQGRMLILDDAAERPAALQKGALPPEQRDAWCRGRR